MQSLALALRAKTDEGQPLPQPFASLARIGVRFRRSQVSLIAGAPGSGKSALATHMVVHMGVPTMYFSADADRMTVAKSVVAGLSSINQDDAETRLSAEDPDVMKSLAEGTRHIWWNFDTQPTVKDVVEEIEAYAYVYGNYPEMLVVDNLMDMAEDDLNAMNSIQVELKSVARKFGCHILILAHVLGEYTDGVRPIPRSGMMWKPDKKAELIMTLYNPTEGVMGIGVVKNRSGPANTSGTWGVTLRWLPRLGYFGD